MIKSVLFTMSLMGSTMFIAYLILCPFLKKFFSVKIRIGFLLASAFFYLFPFPELKYYYYDLISIFYKFRISNNYEIFNYNDYIHKFADDSVFLPEIFKVIIIVSALWLIISSVLLFFKFRNYKILKQNLIKNCVYSDDKSVCEIVNKYKDKLHIKRKIDVLSCDNLSPVTLVLINPKIILCKEMPDEQKEFVIKHELAHIHHKDYIIKIIMILSCILHWYNPLVYFMAFETNRVLEYYADEEVIMDYDNIKRKEYGNTIIDISTNNYCDYNINNMPVNSFGSKNVKIMKERLTEMKNVKKHSKFSGILSAAILSAVVILNSMIVFAYEDIHSYEEDNLNLNGETTEIFVGDAELDPFTLTDNSLSFSEGISEIFIDEDGQIYPINDDENASTNALCNHTYVSGQASQHTKFSDGSCVVKTYNCQRCSKCGSVIQGSLISTTSYAVCPH